MAKKRGRPPKTPSSSKSKASSESPGSQKLDFTQLDEEDLTEIDSLSPKQAERLLKNLDVLREKIKGKAILEEQQGEEQPVCDQETRRDLEDGSVKGDKQSTEEETMRPEKPKSLKTNRAIEEGLIGDNRVDGGGAVRLTTQPESFIEPSKTHQGESSACRLGVVKDKNISTASVRGGVEIDKDIGQNSQWTTVLTRNKKEVELKDHLLAVQSQLVLNPLDVLLQQEEKEVFLKLRDTQKVAYSFLKQKAKVDWMKGGDENSKFFHNAIKQRMYRNRILRIQDAASNFVTGQDQISDLFVKFYK
ncbi:hypothetical protein RIF29_14658 [Crotalaria pallida]|uniref:Uncharacterized protein n=1 Tax=Crotalaria pallida TaxID=3830 RepID=A0AAN9FC10_CROPI